MSETNELPETAKPDDDCPLSVSAQNRNIACFATFWGLFYFAAPVSYIGLTHANLLKDLGNNDTVSNLPSAVYMWLTIIPVFAAWFFPQPRYLKRLGFTSVALMSAMTGLVALTLWLSNSSTFRTAVVIAHGGLFGAVNGISLSTLWDLLRRGVSTSRRGKALGLAFGVGPIFACAGSLLQDAMFQGELLGGRTFGLTFPDNYLAMFAGLAPMMLFAAICFAFFVVPPDDEIATLREPVLEEVRAGLKQFTRNRALLFAVVIYVIVYSGGNAIFANVSLHAKEMLTNDAETVGIQNFLRFGCKAVAGILLGLLLTKSSPRATVVATTSILLAGMIWALSSSGWWYMATFGILGAGELFGAHFPNYITTASAKPFVRINMSYLSVLSVLIGFSSLAFGLISDKFGRLASFYTAAALLLLALGLIFALLPANPTPREDGTGELGEQHLE